jgi:hypothetical protein
MEIVESAACGIAEREFQIKLESGELETMLDFVRKAKEGGHLNQEIAGKIEGALEENMSAGEAVLELKETDIAVFYKGLKAALESGVECEADFTDDLFSYMEQVVGSALEE